MLVHKMKIKFYEINHKIKKEPSESVDCRKNHNMFSVKYSYQKMKTKDFSFQNLSIFSSVVFWSFPAKEI